MRISFSGLEADEHRLEAYEGLKSLDGLVRVATIAAHYAATGEVRFRAPFSNLLEVHLSGIRNGSFEFIFDQISNFLDATEGASARIKANSLFRRLVARGTGQAEEEALLVDGQRISPGDIDAMTEAAEAAIVAAHRWINDNEKAINLVDGDERLEINSKTKIYVETQITGPERTQDVSVAALNVNSKTGRVFFFDLGRTLPFIVSKDATSRTVPNLSRYLNEYARKTGATVNILFRTISHVDGRLKRIIIEDCFPLEDAA